MPFLFTKKYHFHDNFQKIKMDGFGSTFKQYVVLSRRKKYKSVSVKITLLINYL